MKSLVTFSVLFVSQAIFFWPTIAIADYSDSCGSYASSLSSAASSYDTAKSSFESACSPYYGYARNDRSACDSYGYERTPYETAKNNLKSALSNVSMFCGVCDHIIDPILKSFKKKVKELEDENSKLRAEVKILKKEMPENK